MDNQFSEARPHSVTPEIPSPVPVAPPPTPTLSEVLMGHLMRFGVSALILAGIWVVATVVLRANFLVGMQTRDALGFATIITLVSFFFLRTLIPGLSTKKQPVQTHAQPTDSAREVVETVVFVVVLVLLLKSFAAEAFVIPTGSMAQTLYGYQKIVKCPQCDIEFPVNCATEVEPTEGQPQPVLRCACPNCRQDITLVQASKDPNKDPSEKASSKPGVIPDPGWNSGDRVLVAKFVYDLLDRIPDRLDVVVFKFPGDESLTPFPQSGPIKKHVPINYIKRLIGRPGETIAIHRGKLFVLSPEKALEKGLVYNDVSEAGDDPAKKALLWRLPHTHHNDAVKNFEDGDFSIVRKKPANLLSMRRIVYDNDHQAKDLTDAEYQRWRPAENAAWKPSGKTAFAHEGTGNGSTFEWLHYKHILRGSPGKPQLITDVMGYNSAVGGGNGGNWASDLMLECQVDVTESKGSFAMEISRGAFRYQALFDLATGTCSLYQVGPPDGAQGGDFADAPKPVVTELKSVPTSLAKKGSYHLRFANMDDRLAVWVDEHLVFGDGVELVTPRTLVPTPENDQERPTSLGSRDAKVSVSKIKIFRDTYYTLDPSSPDSKDFQPDDPKTWAKLAELSPSTYYVQPGHFLCLGDNSPQSSDGRTWGLVPQRLLLGRALLVYWPATRAGRIR